MSSLVLCGCLAAPDGAGPRADGDGGSPDAAPPPPDAACSWTDEFPPPELDPLRWEPAVEGGLGSVDVVANRAVLEATPAAGEYVYVHIRSTDVVNLAHAEATVNVSVDVTGSGDSMMIWDSQDEWIGIGVDSGLLEAARGDAAGTLFETLCSPCPEYSAAQHRFWRLRADGAMLHFEASADGVTWNVEVAPPVPLPWDTGRLFVWAECGAPNRLTTSIEHLTVTTCGS